MRVKVNAKDEGEGRTLVPEGTYKARVYNCEKGESASGNPMMIWSWKIQTPGESQGEEVRSWTVLPPAPAFSLVNHLRGLGVPETDDGDMEFDPEDMVGRMALIKIEIRDYKNRDGETTQTNSIKKVIAIEKKSVPAGIVPEDDDEEEGVPF